MSPAVQEAAPTQPQQLRYDTDVGLSDTVAERVQRIAIQTMAQLAVTLSIDVALMVAFAAPVGATFVAVGLAIGIGIWAHETHSLGEGGSPVQALRRFAGLQKCTAIALGALGQAGGPGYFIHELGHYVAALACYNDAKPSIIVNPFRGGLTTFDGGNGLTRFGSLMGARGSMALFAVAGVVSSTLFAMGGIEVAHRLRHQCRWARQIVVSLAVTQLVSEVFYGLGVFFVREQGMTHDFLRLWYIGGIHPLIPIALIIALPLLQYIFHELGAQAARNNGGGGRHPRNPQLA